VIIPVRSGTAGATTRRYSPARMPSNPAARDHYDTWPKSAAAGVTSRSSHLRHSTRQDQAASLQSGADLGGRLCASPCWRTRSGARPVSAAYRWIWLRL